MATDLDFVEETWKALGHRIRPLRRTVFVRTLPFPEKVGLIWLPPKLTSFHGEMPHLRMIDAIVLALGPDAAKRGIKVGEKVCFQRLHFAYIHSFSDIDRVGWIDVTQIVGYPEDQAA